MSCQDPAVQTFWRAFIATLPGEARPGPCEAWGFGDGPAMADALGRLVLEGPKRATAGLLKSYHHEGEPLPRVGQHSVILDGRGAQLCVIETSEVEVKPFDRVAFAFVVSEGEGDRSLDYWREAHRRFFGRECEQYGARFQEDDLVVCERFRLVYRGD